MRVDREALLAESRTRWYTIARKTTLAAVEPRVGDRDPIVKKNFVLYLSAILCAACAAQPSHVSTAAPRAEATPARDLRGIRDLAIIPSDKAICPGLPVQVRYEAVLSDGSRVTLSTSELSHLALRGIAALPAADGSWITSGKLLESAVSGFRLSASLATDPGVHADTVIVPSYSCQRLSIGLPVSDRFKDTKAKVRVGVFASPFYDSIAVAVMEPEGGFPIVLILDPAHMRPRSLQVSALGKAGQAGGAGNPGNDGGQCEDGGNGTDGDPGESGESGGRVDIIVQAESPWLQSLVAVTNSGGRGGAGGRGGYAGRAGPRTSEPTCSPKPGRPGRAGQSGTDGHSGPYPNTTTEPGSLLWHGSPVWFDSTARANLEQLMELGAQRRSKP
jgi:hypothetical protein